MPHVSPGWGGGGGGSSDKCIRFFLIPSVSLFLLEDCKAFQPYKMVNYPRGKCIVINNLTFDEETSERLGAKHDEDRLKDLFEELGFVVEIKRNLTRDEMYKLAKDVAADDHSNFDAFVLIIMSHGGTGGDAVIGVDGRAARIEEIMDEFKAISCASLQIKPKLFFIQCCTGNGVEFMPPVQSYVDNPMPRFTHDSALTSIALPREAHFLLAFADVPGYYAYQHADSGSVFFQVIVKEFSFIQFHHIF